MSTRPAAPRASGVTLIELLVTVAMSAVIIAGAVALFLGQQRAFRAGATDRSIQESARVALEEITGNLRRAGYGIDQGVAFDFGRVGSVWLENTPPSAGPVSGEPIGAAVTALAPADCSTPVLCRDSISGPDELVFRYRSPTFGPHVLSATPTTGSLSITGGITNGLAAGQELLVICYGAEPRVWAYVTVDTAVAPVSGAPPATTSVTLRTSNGTSSRDFPQQVDLLGNALYNGCFARTGADAPRVFLVERLRYFIQTFADADGSNRPYLMVSRGLDSNPQPVAPDVEDLQVAYVFPFIEGRTPAGTASPNLAERIVGSTGGTRLASSTGSIDLASAFPTLNDLRMLTSDPTTGPLSNRTPANIRAVRVALVVRSPVADSPANTVIPASLNRLAVTPATTAQRYRRFQVESTVFLNNMTNVHSYAPYYRSISSAPGALVGGG